MIFGQRFLFMLLLVTLLPTAGYLYGRHKEHQAAELREQAISLRAVSELAAANQKVHIAQTALQDTVNRLQADRKKEQDDAQTKINSLRHDVRVGALRLSVAIRAAGQAGQTSDTASARGTATEERAELLPEDAETFIRIAGDADNEVRRTNLCIDQYNAIIKAANQTQETGSE